jgi:hypothetical protein
MREKADIFGMMEGNSLGRAKGDVSWTPPGSEARACSHGGNLGTREIQLSPCVKDTQRIG